METVSAMQVLSREIYRLSVEFLLKRLVLRNFDVLFVVSLNWYLDKQYSCRWFEPTWRLCRYNMLWVSFEDHVRRNVGKYLEDIVAQIVLKRRDFGRVYAC